MFHRLTAPVYIGGSPLPVDYDYLNNLLGGTPAPVDSVKADGPNVGTLFVAFGEDGRAGAVNRALSALATNTDNTDDFLHSDTAVTTSVDITGAAIIVGTVANPVYRGPTGTPNTQAGLEPYFHVTDLSNNDIVDVATNTQSVVTSITVNPGVGFFVGSITLAVSPAPVGTYRIWYGTRSSLADMTKGEFVRQNVWGVQRKQAGFIQFTNNLVNSDNDNTKGGSLVGISDATFNADVAYGGGLGGLGIVTVQQAIRKINDRFFAGAGKVEVDTDGFIDTVALTPIRGGGIGAAFAPGSVQQALAIVDKQLVRRRAFTAVMTDGISSIGGDYNGSNIDAMLTAAGSSGGSYFARSGTYYIGTGTIGTYQGAIHVTAEGFGIVLALEATRALDLALTSTFLIENINLVSVSTTYKRFKIIPSLDYFGARFRHCQIQAGAVLVVATGGFVDFSECQVVAAPALGGSSTNAGMDISGEVRTSIRNSSFTGANGTTPRNFYLHDQTDPSKSGTIVENSYFLASDANVHAIELNNVSSYVTFTNCVFQVTATSGTGYAARITNCSRVTFNNCRFVSANGQVLKVTGSTAHFYNCLWESTDAVPNAAASQMIVIQQGNQGSPTINNCHCFIGASSVRGSTFKAVIELGGLDGTASGSNGITVNGLFIRYTTATALTHSYTALILHGNTSTRYINLYRGIQFDQNSTDSSAGQTPGGNYYTEEMVVEIGGAVTRENCVVEDLEITNLRNPTASHDGGVLYADTCMARNIRIEGSSVVAAGGFNNVLVTFLSSRVENLSICKNFFIRMVGVAGWYLGLEQTRLTGGGLYLDRDPPATLLAISLLGTYSTMIDYTINVENVTAGGAKIVLAYLFGDASQIAHSYLNVTGDLYGIPFISTAGRDCRVADNRLMTENANGFAMITLGAANTLSFFNLCVAQAGGAPPATIVAVPATSVSADYQRTTLVTALPY